MPVHGALTPEQRKVFETIAAAGSAAMDVLALHDQIIDAGKALAEASGRYEKALDQLRRQSG